MISNGFGSIRQLVTLEIENVHITYFLEKIKDSILIKSGHFYSIIQYQHWTTEAASDELVSYEVAYKLSNSVPLDCYRILSLNSELPSFSDCDGLSILNVQPFPFNNRS